MRLKYLLILLLVFCFCEAFGQTYSSVISDEEIVGFVKQLSHDTIAKGLYKIDREIWEWDEEQFASSDNNLGIDKVIARVDSCKKYLSKNDLEFMKLQSESQLTKTWNSADFEGYLLISEQGKDEIYTKSRSGKRTIKNNYFSAFSLPLFNKEKNIAILRYDWSAGFMFANQCTCLLKLNNGKWKIIKKWDQFSE